MAASLSACCTLHDGTRQSVKINTNAPAKYTIRNEDGYIVSEGIAPAVVVLKRGDAPYKVTLKRTDSSPEAMGVIGESHNGWVWGNVFTLSLIGVGIDYATGAAWNLDDAVTVNTQEETKQYQPVVIHAPVNTPVKRSINAPKALINTDSAGA